MIYRKQIRTVLLTRSCADKQPRCRPVKVIGGGGQCLPGPLPQPLPPPLGQHHSSSSARPQQQSTLGTLHRHGRAGQLGQRTSQVWPHKKSHLRNIFFRNTRCLQLLRRFLVHFLVKGYLPYFLYRVPNMYLEDTSKLRKSLTRFKSICALLEWVI